VSDAPLTYDEKVKVNGVMLLIATMPPGREYTSVPCADLELIRRRFNEDFDKIRTLTVSRDAWRACAEHAVDCGIFACDDCIELHYKAAHS
jgi:hypothetical protein